MKSVYNQRNHNKINKDKRQQVRETTEGLHFQRAEKSQAIHSLLGATKTTVSKLAKIKHDKVHLGH